MPVFPRLLPAFAALLLAGTAGADDLLDTQRQLFRELRPAAERGELGALGRLDPAAQAAIRSYALWPDLQAMDFRARIRNAAHADIEAFLDRFGSLKPARDLRYAYALHLARARDDDGYLRIYKAFYQGLDDPQLDCLALAADIRAGRTKAVAGRAEPLWLVGFSQVDACDPVFAHLKKSGELDRRWYERRYALAIDARNFTLARWLGRSLDEGHVDNAGLWLTAQTDPQAYIRRHRQRTTDAAALDRFVYALERLTYADPVRAHELWSQLERRQPFSEKQRVVTARHIALWTARDRLDGAHALLADLSPAAANDEVWRWRARVSLREGNWEALLIDIAGLSAEEREAEEWQYWRAVGLQATGNDTDANAILETLAGERSFYGFLAADAIGSDYSLNADEMDADAALLEELAARPDLVRARELFLVGLESRGRSEWSAAMRSLSVEEQQQAAILAHRWGWHSRAIATAAMTGDYDDLELRYPLPYRPDFEQFADKARISPTWAYGIARSESLFMRDVRSSAGAIGLMQLMPATGRSVARDLRRPWSGISTLTDPAANIQLGTAYLGRMAERFGGNPVLATAAYNAGPHRVDAWLPAAGPIDARIWIENIPFNETRGYVRRVFAANTIFHWRLTGETRRVSADLVDVVPAADARRVAAR